MSIELKFSIVSFVVIIRIVIVAGLVLVSGIIIIITMFKCNYDCYSDYYCILIAFNLVRFRTGLGCPGSLMSLYGPTFHATPIELCIKFQCKNYIYIYIYLLYQVLWKQTCMTCITVTGITCITCNTSIKL